MCFLFFVREKPNGERPVKKLRVETVKTVTTYSEVVVLDAFYEKLLEEEGDFYGPVHQEFLALVEKKRKSTDLTDSHEEFLHTYEEA